MKRSWTFAALAALAVTGAPMAACGQSQPAAGAPLTFQSSGDIGFDAWRAGFAERAIARGRDPAIVFRLLNGVSPDQSVITADRRQPEFVAPVWDYVTRAVSARRIEDGRAKRAALGDVLARVGAQYQVDTDIVLGIWALESNFGRAALPYDAATALATLAFEGRRRAQFETYLLALIEMVERGYAGPSELRSSWAGALGQPQFMPDVYLTTSVDWNSDGRRDIWNDDGDVAASIANYLRDRGWRANEPTFLEARLPPNFDYALSDGTRRTIAGWAALGVAPVAGRAFDASQAALDAELFLPAGAQGPALLLLPNFQVIRRYNASDRYALVISLLARGFAGEGATLSARWPTHLGALQRDDIIELQTLLNALGHSAGAPDGLFGSNTRRAVRAFQQSRNLPADGFPTPALLRDLRRAAGPGLAATAAPIATADLDQDGVRALQRELNRLGFSAGTPDGAAGPRTRAAIREFERSQGREITGRPTQDILAAAQEARR